MKLLLPAALLCLGLAGCGMLNPLAGFSANREAAEEAARKQAVEQTGDPNAQANPLDVLKQFTLADLRAALDATPPEDVLALACWQGLIPIVEQLGAGGTVGASGAFSGFQKVRNLRRGQGQLGMLHDRVRLACSPLIDEVGDTVFKIAAKVGLGGALVTGTGGAGALLPVLPGLP